MLSSGSNVTGELWKTIFPNRRIVRWHLYRNWPTMKYASMGHSCNISNAPNLVPNKLKTAFWVFLVYFWYGFILTKMGKAMGELKLCSNTFVRQDLRYFCPGNTLAISNKITCQSLNFICQTLEKSLQFADRTYKLKKSICFQVPHKIWFFWPKSELVIFSWIL